jgi:hypothetical protein
LGKIQWAGASTPGIATKTALLKRQAEMQADTRNDEPAAEDRFETAFFLYDFLDYCSQNGILSTFERDLLIKVKMDGFEVKELLNRHTVLSPKAVYVRIQRIMKRLQEATTMPPPDRELAQDREIKQRRKDRKSSQSMSTFCLSNSTDFLPISKSRRQLSPDSSAMRSEGKRQHLRP